MRFSPKAKMVFVAASVLAAPLAVGPRWRDAAAAPQPAEPVVAKPAVAPTVAIVGRVTMNGAVPLPGVLVQLSGPVSGPAPVTAVSDAGGAFVFRVPPGSYVLGPRPAIGAVFAPEAVRLDGMGSDVIQDFSCSGACATGPAIVAGKELVITDPSVVNDGRASNTAADRPWSFRFLVEQMAPPGSDPADFVAAWLAELERPNEVVNGFPVDARNVAALRALWPTSPSGKLDLAQAPFRLLAITNRVDLHATSNGEARFVYGAVDPAGAGRPMTVIFEFALPSVDPRTRAPLGRADWAARFHALGGLPFGPGYGAALQAITDLFTLRNTCPDRPGGSSIAQVRINEILMGGPWQMRELHLSSVEGVLGLRLATTAGTPPDSAATDGTPPNLQLLRYLASSRAALHGAYAPLPGTLMGGQASETFSWQLGAGADAGARHAFAGQTCNGCHFSETSGLQIGGFYHVSPTAEPGPDGTGRLSNFMRLVEIARRIAFMQNLLTCTGATCAPGAEPALL
jgi:hypothetical protein